jgi:hypothetical protein
MERSESINELATALAVAQGVIEGAAKDSANPFFKSKYADLASVWDAIRAPLAENGLSVLQLPSAEGPKVTITTMLAHKSGQWIQSALTVTAKEDTPQAVGSAITYARRYALQSVVGVAPEDDDGERAQGRDTPTQKAAPKPRHTPAQQEVIDRKLAEMPTPPEPKPWQVPFRAMAQKLGEANYSRILGSNGFESARQIPDQVTAKKILDEMTAELHDMAASRGVV